MEHCIIGLSSLWGMHKKYDFTNKTKIYCYKYDVGWLLFYVKVDAFRRIESTFLCTKKLLKLGDEVLKVNPFIQRSLVKWQYVFPVGKKIVVMRWQHAEAWISLTTDTADGFELEAEFHIHETPNVVSIIKGPSMVIATAGTFLKWRQWWSVLVYFILGCIKPPLCHKNVLWVTGIIQVNLKCTMPVLNNSFTLILPQCASICA